ncbi:MAG: PilZ domain-containing protein [Hyphomicrobiaceae bacterium]|nr:PilZ domain-containing protein [Hyphomicrobiaceae bacterium]
MSFGKGRVRPISAPKMPPIGGSEGNRRWSMRRTMSAPGLVWPGGSAPTIPCTIADMSGTGARLLMQRGWVNPFRGVSSVAQQFTLLMRFDRMQVQCEIMRIDDQEIGVRFISPPSPMDGRAPVGRALSHVKVRKN